MLVFVAYAGSKLELNPGETIEAQKLYSPSAIFSKRLKYAKSITTKDKIFILSAKYGLVKLNDKLEYYDLYLGKQSEIYKYKWTNKVINQMKEQNIDFNEEVYFAAGKEYYKGLKSYFKNSKFEIDEVKKDLGRSGIGMSLKYYDIKNGVKKNEEC